MSFNPGDFFLGIVTFLGVLVPGAVVLFLQGDRLTDMFGPPDTAIHWVAFGVAAYIVGQLLLAVSELLNYISGPVAKRLFPQLRRNVVAYRKNMTIPVPAVEESDRTAILFHAALSYVRLHNAEAAAEIDRHMADYKLLRSLVFVFVIDLTFSLWKTSEYSWRPGIDLLLVVVAFWAFVRMHHWAQLLAFQYVDLIGTPPRAHPGSSKSKT